MRRLARRGLARAARPPITAWPKRRLFSCLGYDYYGRSSNRGMPLATISDIFYCLWAATGE